MKCTLMTVDYFMCDDIWDMLDYFLQVGFVKAFSDSPEAFTTGFCQLERIMKNMFLKHVYLWPRWNLCSTATTHCPLFLFTFSVHFWPHYASVTILILLYHFHVNIPLYLSCLYTDLVYPCHHPLYCTVTSSVLLHPLCCYIHVYPYHCMSLLFQLFRFHATVSAALSRHQVWNFFWLDHINVCMYAFLFSLMLLNYVSKWPQIWLLFRWLS